MKWSHFVSPSGFVFIPSSSCRRHLLTQNRTVLFFFFLGLGEKVVVIQRGVSKCTCFSKWYSQSLWIAPNYPPTPTPTFPVDWLSYSKSQLWLYFRILWPTFCCNCRKLCLLILDLHVDRNDTLAGELLLKLLAASEWNHTSFGPNSHSGYFILFLFLQVWTDGDKPYTVYMAFAFHFSLHL